MTVNLIVRLNLDFKRVNTSVTVTCTRTVSVIVLTASIPVQGMTASLDGRLNSILPPPGLLPNFMKLVIKVSNTNSKSPRRRIRSSDLGRPLHVDLRPRKR